jgi:Cu-processing system permease protein
LAFALLVGTSVLLGAAFIAIGYLVSVLVRDRGTAGGIAIGVWLLFVLVYDMGLLGALVADQGRTVTADVLNLLLLLNPTDAFRLLNLAGTPGVASFSGLAGLAAQVRLGPLPLAGALGLWVAVPLAAAMTLFSRRQI